MRYGLMMVALLALSGLFMGLHGATVSTTLSVQASDDGLPNPPAALTYTWNLVSGPATPTISPNGTTGSATTTATFSVAGTYVFTVTISDSQLSTVSNQVTVTVLPSNTSPTISNIADRSTNEDTATSAIAFTVGDTQTAAGSLTVSGSSSNTTLVPNANIVFGGSGANRTVSVTPAANQSGTATISVTVSDGSLTATDTFVLTVTAVNDAPTISNIADQSTTSGVATSAIAFTVGDVETAAGSLTLSGSSSNTTLLPTANIVFGGSGANRTLTLTPATGQTGTATVTVTVSDGSLSASDTLVLTVNAAPSTATPTISSATGTSTPTPTLSGNATGGSTIRIYDGASLLGTVTAAAGGGWTWTASPALASGTHTLTVTAMATGFTESAPSVPVTVTVPTGGGSTPGVKSGGGGGGGGCGMGGLAAMIGASLAQLAMRRRRY